MFSSSIIVYSTVSSVYRKVRVYTVPNIRNIEREIPIFGREQIAGGRLHAVRVVKGRSKCPLLWEGGRGTRDENLTPPLSNHLSPSVCHGIFNRRQAASARNEYRRQSYCKNKLASASKV
jgi:hypothetical protein